MLICKYTRRENAAFVPHLDMLRTVTMAVRRIGAKAQYSEGFNPHMKIFFGQPLPIGTESDCEYFCLYADEDPQTFREKINASLPQGVAVTAAAYVEKDPNVAKLMYFADYTVTMRCAVPNLREFVPFCMGETCVISYTAKGNVQEKDVRTLIESVQVLNDTTVRLRLRCGNANLRADRLVGYWCACSGVTCGFDTVKTHMYDYGGNDLDTILLRSRI